MERFDLCVIGAGPSGYAATMRALDLGKRVLLIEKNRLGGAGIWNGALSSKTLWELSEAYKLTRSTNKGYVVYDSEINYQDVIAEMRRAVNERYAQLKEQIEVLERTSGLTFVQGMAQLADKNSVDVTLPDGKVERYEADDIIIAIGSRPRYLPDIPIDEKTIVTSDGISSFEDFPKSIVILGAGVIGCEFATIFSNFGKTKVFLIDKQDRILPFEDEDISRLVGQNLEANGVTIHRNSSLKEMKQVDGQVQYTILCEDGREEVYTVEKALVSVGRVPNVENIGLYKVGMELDNRGYAIDDDTVTSIPNIYAVGDFTADIALVNIAEMEGRFAVERIYTDNPTPMTYENISTIMFLNPEVAGVGMNEIQAKRKGIAYRCAKMPYKLVGRAIAQRNTSGFFKILVTDDEEMKILGMRAMGNHASSTIEAMALLIKKKMGIRELADLIHPHPSIVEGIMSCARMLLGKSIMKPEVFHRDMSCYRVSAKGKVENLFNGSEDLTLKELAYAAAKR